MLYGKIIKILLSAILLGLLLFLNHTALASSLSEKFLKFVEPVLSRAFYLKQSLSGTEDSGMNESALRAEVGRLLAENNSLRRALRFSEEKYRLEGSRVIHYRVEFGKEFLLIDKGKEDGIKTGDAVVDSFGFLVGVSKEVQDSASVVEVISNPGQTLEVEILPLQARALAKGIGARGLVLDLLPQGASIRKGDIINLLGVGGVRRSLLVGEVASVKSGGNSAFLEAGALIGAKPEALREVFIVK